jgi:hypothetical protein
VAHHRNTAARARRGSRRHHQLPGAAMICGARFFCTIACTTGHGNGCAQPCRLLRPLVDHREPQGHLNNRRRTSTSQSRQAATATRTRRGVAQSVC